MSPVERRPANVAGEQCRFGGFAILEAASMAEAVALTKRFLRLHGNEWDIECEVRRMEGPE